MDVVIKKSKLTASILAQVFILSEQDIFSRKYTALGWCHSKGFNWMVFQDNENNLKKCLIYSKFIEEDTTEQIDCHGARENRYNLFVRFPGNIADKKFWYKTEREREAFGNCLEDLKTEALQKGQFFI